MRIRTIDVHTTTNALNALPIRLEQRSNATSAVLFLIVLIPAIFAMLTPVVVLATLAATDPATRAALADHASSALLIALGLGLWATVLGIPARRFIAQLGAKREIEISNGQVHVIDTTLHSRNAWSCPLSAFSGLKHNIRTTISDARHELVLVHTDTSKYVLIHMAPNISDTETTLIARLLGQRVIGERAHERAHATPLKPVIATTEPILQASKLAA